MPDELIPAELTDEELEDLIDKLEDKRTAITKRLATLYEEEERRDI